jgi:hypothetical protein
MTLHQYLKLYKQPLPKDSMQTIVTLTEIAVNKQKKQTKDKKSKKEKNIKMALEDKACNKKKGKRRRWHLRVLWPMSGSIFKTGLCDGLVLPTWLSVTVKFLPP